MSSPQASNVYVFVIVGKGDTPLYEADLSTAGKREDTPHLDQFVIHTALDMVDEIVWQNTNMYCKVVDRFNEYLVSAFVTAGHTRFMLLHKQQRGHDDNVHQFFKEVHEHFIRAMLNPFQEPTGLITSSIFDDAVKNAAQKTLFV
eukprot:GHVU01038722.1.p1 GENE.GHVU01038722.1~~GHVU01038722.1.p1  ORF type:complete len:145 (+),score=19.79 GHVU01038722.1:35-469(+)